MIHRSTVTKWLESHSRAETWPWNSPRRSWFLETVGKSNFLSSAIQRGHRVPQWDGFRGDNWPMTRWRLKMYVIHLYILCRKYESVFSKLKVSDFDEIFQLTGYMQEALQIQEIHLCWRPLPVIRIQIGALDIFSWGGVWQDKGKWKWMQIFSAQTFWVRKWTRKNENPMTNLQRNNMIWFKFTVFSIK